MSTKRYRVQIGRYDGSYKTVVATDSATRASIMFNGYNVHSGYKKRLLDGDKVHARVLTNRY